MKRIPLLLPLLASLWVGAVAPPPRGPIPANHVIIIDRSSTVVSGAKATLSISPLRRTGNVYAGEYQMKVSPYFFKNEKGRLAIVVSDESLGKVTNGLAAEITGTATSSGKGGQTRRIDATAVPADNDRGALKLWFTSGNNKMVFNTSYRFLEP